MSNLKRFLSLTLAIVMVVGGMAFTGVSAKPFSDIDKKTDAELYNAVSLLNDLGVVLGTSTEGLVLDGDALVTRAQFALFMARIRTATPEYFYSLDPADPETTKAANTYFDDLDPVRDAPYIIAINYCAENGIVEGKEARKYYPTDAIKLQEAIKMCTIALGWTGLSYPQGYLSKASEVDVALLGANVETPGFDFKGVVPTKDITRAEMVEILYNFLLSRYVYLDMVWNAVDSRYESRSTYEDVIAKFGIEKVLGYVTGIEGYAADLHIRDYNNTGVPVYLEGRRIAHKEANNAVSTLKKDIEISYANITGLPTLVQKPRYALIKETIHGGTGVTSSTVIGTYNSGSNSVSFNNSAVTDYNYIDYSKIVGYETVTESGYTTGRLTGKKTEFGFFKEDGTTVEDSLYLLGLKVVIYRDIRKNPAYKIALPSSRVIGEKTDVDVTKTNAKFSERSVTTGTTVPTKKVDYKTITEYTLNGVTYDQKEPLDLDPDYNVYAFTTYDATLRTANAIGWGTAGVGPDSNSKAEDRLMSLLARFAKDGKPNFKLQYIDNGGDKTREDTSEFFYIFIPFQVGTAYTKDGNKRLGDAFDTDGVRYDFANSKVTDVSEGKTAGALADQEAYFYTNYGAGGDNDYGNYIDVYGKLEKTASKVVVEAISTHSAVFTTNITVTTDYVKTASRAVGALNLAWLDFTAKDTYNLYKDSAGNTMFAYKSAKYTPPGYQAKDYGVILVTGVNPGTASPQGAPGYLTGGVIGYTMRIFNTTKNIEEVILVTNYNGKSFDPASDGLPGDYITMTQLSNGGYAVYNAENVSGTPIATAFESIHVNNASGKEYVDYQTTIANVVIANNVLNVDTTDISSTAINHRAVITSSTKIVAYSTLDTTSGAIVNQNSYAKLISKDTLATALAGGIVNDILFAAREPKVGNANVIFVACISTDLKNLSGITLAPDRYGYVVDNLGAGVTGQGGSATNNSTSSVTYYTDAYGNLVQGGATYYINSALVYETNGAAKVVPVCSTIEKNLFPGNFIRITSQFIDVTMNGTPTRYFVVDSIDSLLSGTGYTGGATAADPVGTFGSSPTAIWNSLLPAPGGNLMVTNNYNNGPIPTDSRVSAYVGYADMGYTGGALTSITLYDVNASGVRTVTGSTFNTLGRTDFKLLVMYGTAATTPSPIAGFGNSFASKAPDTGIKGISKLSETEYNAIKTNNANGLAAVIYVYEDGTILGVTLIVNATGKTNNTWDKAATGSVWFWRD